MQFEPFRFLIPEQPVIEQKEFERATHLLKVRAGIILGEHKREMAARTLSVRAKKLQRSNITDYLTFLDQNPQSPEWNVFVNAFTVNHTAFFREEHHFGILTEFARTRRDTISIWCCAASTGEEPYSLAITLQEAARRATDPPATIWATDIDTQAIARARKGVYPLERVKPVPENYLKKYFYRGKAAHAGMVRVKPIIQNMVHFEPFNLLSPAWPADKKFDAIFCRNIMIYFDKQTQTKILDRFAPMIKPGGLLFVGHSENFTYLTKAFRLRGQTVYTPAHSV